ncbi:hypothetical protein BGZ65_003712, partial [Modicella reniformis]
MALGGGSFTSMLLGMPPSWLGSNVVVPTYVLSFFLVQYTILYDILNDMVPSAVLDSILIISDGSLKAMSISKLAVDGSRMRFAADSHYGDAGGLNEPWFAMLLLGVIAGSGGNMWTDFLGLNSHQWILSSPTFVHMDRFDVQAALLSSFFYAASTSPQFYGLLHDGTDTNYTPGKRGLMEDQDAKAMTILVMCTLMLGQRVEPAISRYTGFSISPTKWLGSFQTRVAMFKKRDDDGAEHDPVSLNRVGRDETYRPLRRRSRKSDERAEEMEVEENEKREEEEEEEEPVKKGSRSGIRVIYGKRLMSPTRVAPTSPGDATLIRSTRT